MEERGVRERGDGGRRRGRSVYGRERMCELERGGMGGGGGGGVCMEERGCVSEE